MSSPLLLWTPPRFVLPEYVLDFGSIIPGKVFSHTVNVTNTGSVPVSFHANCKNLIGTGMQYIIILWCFHFFTVSVFLYCHVIAHCSRSMHRGQLYCTRFQDPALNVTYMTVVLIFSSNSQQYLFIFILLLKPRLSPVCE